MAFGSESEETESVSNIIFSTVSAEETHQLDKTSIKSSAYWKSKDTVVKNDKKKYCCMVKGCSANFSRPWRLNAHLSVHYGKKPFPCNVKDCNKAYTSVYHLRRHKANAHESSVITLTPFKCEFTGCNAEFKTRQNAKKHFKRTHEGRTCKECGQIFTKRSQLITHQYDHTGITPFKCATCDKGFLRKGELRKHERIHIEHLCPEKSCFLTFKSWNEVRKHLITHPRNYVCILCRKSYLCRKKLKEHILKHGNPESNEKRKTLLKKFQCDLCPASLVGKASLRRHISVIHEGNRGQGKDPNEPPKKRKPRKDKGSIKKAMATILADIKVPLPVDKKILQRDGDDLIDDDELVQTVFQQMTTMQTPVEEACSDDVSNITSSSAEKLHESS